MWLRVDIVLTDVSESYKRAMNPITNAKPSVVAPSRENTYVKREVT
jgi:hypothetical protein